MNNYYYPEERIAVVAMGGNFPDADNIDSLWNNILRKKVSIKEVPDHIFDKKVFYRPEVFGKSNKNDKTYTKVAAIPNEIDISAFSRKYKIPPAVAEYMDPNQHTTIYSVDQALQRLKCSLPKERTAVILNNGAPGKNFENITRRTFFANIESHLRNHPELASSPLFSQLENALKQVSDEVLKDTLPVTEDSSTGYLQNITAARVANIFDFWGPSYTVDAACASTLAAVACGVSGLLNGEYDAVVTGGSEVTISEIGLSAFSGINALSPDGEYPFDSRANGFVMGLGGGILILKRLSDAIRDGDHIFSVISGYGQGSDGKGKYIAAPSEEGQVRVIQSACKMAGYPVDTIELIEAHGTGTIVGDVVEISAMKKAFNNLGASRKNYCGVGSIKSNIGHLRNAAGAASMIKATLALNNKILPPSANIKEINPKLQLEGSPFYILTDEKTWKETKIHPRRANVSAYGFGGADFHICLEEFRPEFLRKIYPVSKTELTGNKSNEVEDKKSRHEVVFFSGNSFEDVKNAFYKFTEIYNDSFEFGKAAFLSNSTVSANRDWRLAICCHSMFDLKEKWDILEKSIINSDLESLGVINLKGIYLGRGKGLTSDKAAWMFPGQASQYPNMLSGIYKNYPAIESFYMQADAIWNAKYGYSILPLIFGTDEELLKDELKDTKNTHPAIFLSNMALFKLLSESGVRADYMIGHSLGEITALFASGMLDLKSAMHLIGTRGFSFDGIPENERGQMVSIKADKKSVLEIIERNGFNINIANINSPDQIVVGGTKDEISRLTEFLAGNKITSTLLNVSHAFHTGITLNAAESFYSEIAQTKFNLPKADIMCCHLVDLYPNTKESLNEIPRMLRDQIVSPVNFVDSILKLYEKGVRLFIETGPSSVLTNFVKKILDGKEVKVVTSNNKSRDSVEAFNQTMAELFSYGVDISMIPTKRVLGLPDAGTYNNPATPLSNQVTASITHSLPQQKESLVYSGVSVGLPGTFKKAFSDDNFNIIFEGKNLIEMLTDDERSSVLDLNITRLLKTEGASTFNKVTSMNEVIQLAGKFGQLDMMKDYLIDEKVLKQMTLTVCAGIAGGYEALKDAGIPLVREYIKTASGASLPGRWVLPEEMREDTGIIFANGLFPLDSVIDEVSKYIASKFGRKTKNDLIDFYGSVISKVSDNNVKRMLTDWFTLHYSRLINNGGEEDIYEFNHNFMLLLSSQANNRLAQFIGATGPNFYVSAACSSTASAVTIAEDIIRGGHAGRIIVIGADISSIKHVLPWFGGGFLSMGSLTDSADLFKAAVPFDNRRNGMILGSGAVGLILEKEEDVAKRGMNGICRILGTHAFNTAGHQSRIDSNKFCVELDKFLSKMENEHQLDRSLIASKTVYCSHETYSPKNGGCAETEKKALERAFGEKYRELKVISTKGITGHTMGASIEEAVAAKALQYQQIPPIVNYKVPDPQLEGLNLSQGGSYKFDYALRTVVAFGGQGSYHLLQGVAKGDKRIIDKKAYQEWLEGITSSKNAALNYQGRILTAEGESSHYTGSIKNAPTQITKAPQEVSDHLKHHTPVSSFNSDITEGVLEVYSQVTKYPKEMLELTMELEADLGIDTVKQATIFSMLSEKYGFTQEEGVILSNYPTIGHIVDLISGKVGIVKVPDNFVEKGEPFENKTADRYGDEVYRIISEITKYPVDMLDKDMEMEADLGIDTVKQATIFSILGEKFNISEEKTAQISQYRTIGAVMDFVQNHSGKKTVDQIVDKKEDSYNNQKSSNNVSGIVMEEWTKKADSSLKNAKNSAEKQVLELISEITKYPVEMLENDMELEADLGIDTIKQATIFSAISDRFGINNDEISKGSQFKTIGSITDMIEGALKASTDGLAEKNDETTYSEAAASLEGSSDEKEIFDRELCLQIPVFAEQKIGQKSFDLKDKHVWIIGDTSDTVRKASVCFKKITKHVEEFAFKEPETSNLEARISELVSKPVDVIVDVSCLGTVTEYEQLSRSEEGEMLFLNGEARFLFYKKLTEFIPDPEARILCAISMDGSHGYSKLEVNSLNPFMGALCGFYKGLRKEWKKSEVKIIDLGSAQNVQLTNKTISTLVDELEASSNEYEIGYTDDKRTVLKMDYFDRKEFKEVKLPDSPHFVITGGGNGIAAEIILGLAKKIRGKYTILGRTRLPENIEELSLLNEKQLEQKKLEIRDMLKKAGETATPVIIEKEYEKLIKAVSVYKLIKAIESNGSMVHYFDCDVRNYEVMEAALNKAVIVNGPIHVVIHAAGIEKSKLLTQKTQEEFREVFSVKAQGLCNLYRLLDKKELKILIGFSSISGRFGNEAQLDYCAANNFIGSFMTMYKSKFNNVHALSVAWSGWKDTGMAWRNEFVKQHSEEMGINLIEPERGTAEFISVLTAGIEENEIVISKGLSHFIDPGMVYGDLNETPQIDWITKKDGKIYKAFKVLSVKRDPIINNHRLGTTPLMPAVGFIEIFAEYHSLLFGKREQYCFKNIQLEKPLKLFYEKPQEIMLIPRQLKGADDLEGVFYNCFELKHGIPELIELNRMQISGSIGDYKPLLDIRSIEDQDMIEKPCKDMELYNNKPSNTIHLGTLFADEYCKANNVFKYNESGAVYSVFLSEEQITNKKYHLGKLLVNPVFMDSLMQVCGFHTAQTSDKVYLPWEIGEFGVVKVPREVKRHSAYAKLKDETEGVKIYDVILLNEDEEVCYYAKDVKMRRISL